MEERQRTKEIIKPILRGRDIGRYYYKWKDLWVIGTFPALHIDIENYPAIKKYFLDHFKKERLEQSGKVLSDGSKSRKKTANKWFETQDTIAYYSEFEKEKIVWAETDNILNLAKVPSGIYLQKTCFMITGNNLYCLLGILNSHLMKFYIRNIAPLLGSGMTLGKIFVEKCPIPKIIPQNVNLANKIENLVDKILAITSKEAYNPKAGTADNQKVKALEHQIDQLVYKLYDLTPAEIKIVEGSI